MSGRITHAKRPACTISTSTNGAGEANVEVRLPNGRRLGARLHTPESVRAILDECSGLYFWAPGVIVVREISHGAVVTLVEDLIAEGEIDAAFVPLRNG